ncbi:amidohydrolase [Alkalibacillus haloalkaliphilus]|uniref:amidohydrolase n=1 Tax=Alkalibacillus haloalkaliphilus TaxID=94136 RepID=UPI0029356903|nr:amidohydrolase [Alkalibacillus haloalkaliphilus]MDV2582740.1 amidohydrolase [Alkalibacillus haloalkaliphilus]
MLVFKNASGYDGLGQYFEGKVIVTENGKIKDMKDTYDAPSDAEVVDLQGKVVSPGLIDVHTHLGVFEEGKGPSGHDFNETSDANTAQIRAIDGVNPFDVGLEDARKFGVTTVQTLPGSANVIGGEMVVIKTVGTVVDQMVVREPSGLKAATGENPKRVHGGKGKLPTTRMGVAALLRQKLHEAQVYMEKREKGEADYKLELENITKVLKGEMPLRVHAHRAEDIATVLRIKREFEIDVTIEHGTEGHLIPEFIAEHDVSVAVGPTLTARSKVELENRGWETLPTYAKHGVPFTITTDHPVVPIEHLMTSAIMGVKNGLTDQEAMKALTINGAKHLGIEDRVGSLEKGKDADLVIWSGDPFDLRNKVEATYIEGKKVN